MYLPPPPPHTHTPASTIQLYLSSLTILPALSTRPAVLFLSTWPTLLTPSACQTYTVSPLSSPPACTPQALPASSTLRQLHLPALLTYPPPLPPSSTTTPPPPHPPHLPCHSIGPPLPRPLTLFTPHFPSSITNLFTLSPYQPPLPCPSTDPTDPPTPTYPRPLPPSPFSCPPPPLSAECLTARARPAHLLLGWYL